MVLVLKALPKLLKRNGFQAQQQQPSIIIDLARLPLQRLLLLSHDGFKVQPI